MGHRPTRRSPFLRPVDLAIGLRHVEQWTYNSIYHDASQPFNDLVKPSSGTSNTFHYCYPGSDGPLPTVGYYGISAGVNDARYLHALQTVAGTAKKSSSQGAHALARQATEFLGRWRSLIDLEPVNGPLERAEPFSVVLFDAGPHARRA